MTVVLALDKIIADDRCQPRATFDTALVEQYAEAMATGDAFPPVTVFFDGIDHFLADGFHRYRAAKSLGLAEMEADVVLGTLRDAILHSCSANAAHGWRRTNDDKRRAVLRLLNDIEWIKWSDSEIARRCNVSQPFVSRLRPEVITPNVISEPRIYTTKHGTVAVMRTGNIGTVPKLDRPVFDNTDAGSRWQDSAPPARTAQIDNVNRETGLANSVWEIIKAQKTLPGASDAADRFPGLLLHSLAVAEIRAAADWLSIFADGIEHRKEQVNVAAE
jgi:hypothetical protein